MLDQMYGETRVRNGVTTESWNFLSLEAHAYLIKQLPVLSAERINYEWARTNWLQPKPLRL